MWISSIFTKNNYKTVTEILFSKYLYSDLPSFGVEYNGNTYVSRTNYSLPVICTDAPINLYTKSYVMNRSVKKYNSNRYNTIADRSHYKYQSLFGISTFIG